MAEASFFPPPAQEVLLEKRVQEMAINGERPDSPYICRDGKDDASPLAPIPIVDLSIISKEEEELQKLRSALSSWGCFQAIGHGIPSEFLDEIRGVGKEFFGLPMEEKQKYAKGSDEMDGYGGDPIPQPGHPLDWQDRLFLKVYPEDFRMPKFWPQNPKSFSRVLDVYTSKIRMVMENVSKAMARSLQLQEDCFQNQLGERAPLYARFNYYPPSQRPELVFGLRPHVDGSAYTIMLQDDVQGMQVLKDDQWYTVPIISDALVVIMGDQMEIMSNGIFKSPTHRAVTNSEKERITLPIFYYPEKGREIGPEEGLITEERPRMFKRVTDYGDIHWEHYLLDTRALHQVKA